MLCPLKKIHSFSHDDGGDYNEDVFLECEKEKCAWWVEWKPNTLFPEPKHCCAIKLIAEKGV